MVMRQESLKRHVLLINGQRIEDLAGENPVEFGNPDLNQVEEAPDGGVYSRSTSRRGGPVTFHLQPVSNGVKLFMRIREKIRNGERVQSIVASWGDPVLNKSTAMRGGVALRIPPGTTPGNEFAVDVYFDELIPDYDSYSHPSI